MALLRRNRKSSLEPINPTDIAVDLGTATGIVWSGGSFGEITIMDAIRKERTQINHIRSLVARARKLGDTTPSELKLRITQEREQAVARTIYEPDDNDASVFAIGQEAFDQLGRAPNLVFERAVKRGNISNVQSYRAFLRYLIRMKYAKFQTSFAGESTPPRILIGVPRNATEHHVETVRSVIKNDILATPFPVWEQIAAAVGAKLADGDEIPFRNARSCAIADIGGGTMDMAVLSGGSVVDQKSYDTAGDNMDEAIVAYMGSKHNLDIGYRTAIAMKELIGSAMPQVDDDEPHNVSGASFRTEMPGKVQVTRREIRDCLMPVIEQIVAEFRFYLQTLRGLGEVHADIIDNGFYLTGGASLLPGLDEYLRRATGLKIERVANPTTSVIDGLVKMLDDSALLKLGLAA